MATIHPVVDEGLGNSAYVVELGDGRALVVDPARDPTPYLALARWRRLQIAYAAETHLHADFLTGSRELAVATGTQILAPRHGGLRFPHRGLEDGEDVRLGGFTLRTLATLGTPPSTPATCSWAPTWTWVVVANVLLGVNQGLCWSTTVIMKIDLAGPKRRGLAMGLNEAAGYLAVAVTAYLTGLIAAQGRAAAGGERPSTRRHQWRHAHQHPGKAAATGSQLAIRRRHAFAIKR